MNEKILHEAEAFIYDKVNKEAFQVHDDWINWSCEGVDYDINIFTDFHTGKIGATIYPLKRTKVMNIYETNTNHGVRIL